MTERSARDEGERGSFRFRALLEDPGRFTVGMYLRPHYDPSGPTEDLVRAVLGEDPADRKVHTILLSHSVGEYGSPPAVELARLMTDGGLDPVISLSQGSRSREELLTAARGYLEAGAGNLLVVSGDYPSVEGRKPLSGTFDMDSVQTLMFLGDPAGGDFPAEPFKGCVVSPFKTLESEQVWQYEKLARKVKVGAEFIVSQAGFELRKYDELVRFCRLRGFERPLLAHLVVPDLELAERIASRSVPGLSMPAELLKRIDEERERGEEREARLRRAARMTAVLRGLGYRGVLLGGRLEYRDIVEIVEMAESLYESWKECLDESYTDAGRFHYFNLDDRNSLNLDRPAALERRRRPQLMYLMSWYVDYVAFGSWGPVFGLLLRICRFCDARPYRTKALWFVEYLSKAPLYGCRMCGDCALYACGFHCYQRGCPKKIVNGPCGGSRDGWCEVPSPKRKCLWVKAYDSLKSVKTRPSLAEIPIPPKDHRLDGTCSWINFCLGRDHRKPEVL